MIIIIDNIYRHKYIIWYLILIFSCHQLYVFHFFIYIQIYNKYDIIEIMIFLIINLTNYHYYLIRLIIQLLNFLILFFHIRKKSLESQV